MKPAPFVVVFALMLCGCTSRAVLMKPEGDAIDLRLRSQTEPTRMELLAVTDSTLILESAGRLAVADLDAVQDLRVQGYQTSAGSKALALIVPLSFEGVIFGAAVCARESGWQMASFACMAATVALMFSGDPQTRFSPPLDAKEMNKLKLFCRYPQGLTPAQWQSLLDRYDQTEFEALRE